MSDSAVAERRRLARRTLGVVGVAMVLIVALSWQRLLRGAYELQATELTAVARWIAADLESVRRELLTVAPRVASGSMSADLVVASVSPATRVWIDGVRFSVLDTQAVGADDPMPAAAARGRTVADLRFAEGRLRMHVLAPVPNRLGSIGLLSVDLRFPEVLAASLNQKSVSVAILLEGKAVAGTGAEEAPAGWAVPPKVWARLTASERPFATLLPFDQERRLTGLAPWKDYDAWDVVGALVVFAPVDLAVSAAPMSPALLGLILASIIAAVIVASARLLRLGLQEGSVQVVRGRLKATVVAGIALPLLLFALVGGIWVSRVATHHHQRLMEWKEQLEVGSGTAALPGPLDRRALWTDAAHQAAGQTRSTVVWAIALWIAALLMSGVGVFVAWNLSHPTYLRKALLGYAFLAPSALHLLIFSLGPVAFALYISFHNWGLIDPVRPFVGLGNYVQLLRDPDFWNSIKNTALYTLHVPAGMTVSLAIALVMNQRIRGVHVLRTIFFLPSVTSFVAIAMIWQWIYNPDFGLLNWALSLIRLGPFPWLNDPSTALLSLMLLAIWIQAGYQMVIFLAGLQGIPQYLYDAAIVDGASRWQRFRRITLPMLRPTTFFVLVTSVIGSFQVFTQVYVMTEGGPLKSTEVIVYHIYKNAWEYLRMGYASAMSWVLFALVMGITLIQFRYLGKRVEYY